VGRARSPRARAIPVSKSPVSKETAAPAERKGFRLPDGTRAAQSPWVWRGHLMMSLIALGICLTFAVGHNVVFAAAWGVITVGWFGISMWVWRRHLRATS
jgi:hypothetical protein